MGRICCDPTIGRIESGLVGSGLLQVRNSIIEAKDAGILDKNTVIITSPFLRTKESAHIAASLLSARSPLEDDRASERNFGSLNGQSAERYEEVWLQDLSSQGPITYESAPAVMERMMGLVLELCQKYEGETVLLVSHGDPLNILSCALARHSASGHRQLGPFKLGELRPVELVPPESFIADAASATYVS